MNNRHERYDGFLWEIAKMGCVGVAVTAVFIGLVMGLPALLVWGVSDLFHQHWKIVPDLTYGESVEVVFGLWGLALAWKIVMKLVPPIRRKAQVTAEMFTSGSHYTGWNRPIMMTLTATTNPYLRDDLPLRGRVQVFEMGTDDYAMRKAVAFQKINEDGTPVGASVMVDDAEFTYELPPDPGR